MGMKYDLPESRGIWPIGPEVFSDKGMRWRSFRRNAVGEWWVLFRWFPRIQCMYFPFLDAYSKIPWYRKLLFQRENALASFWVQRVLATQPKPSRVDETFFLASQDSLVSTMPINQAYRHEVTCQSLRWWPQCSDLHIQMRRDLLSRRLLAA
jgi:hypothetical protein